MLNFERQSRLEGILYWALSYALQNSRRDDMKIRIVKLDKNNLNDFAELLFRFFEELRRKQGWRSPLREEIEAEAKKALERNDIVLMSYEGAEAVGFVRVSTRHEDAVFWIEEIFVLPKFRRKGIARKLVEAAENEVIKLGERSLYLFVLPQDKDAISFWKSMGYTTLNSIELVKDIQLVRRGKRVLTIELLGEKFDIFDWSESWFDDSEIEFMELLQRFYAQGGDKRTFLSLVNDALKAYLEHKSQNR